MKADKNRRRMFFFWLCIGLSAGIYFLFGFSDPASAEEVETICYACHVETFLYGGYRICSVWVKNGHPVYVVPSKKVKVPAEFPLNERGQIFCGTCHTAGIIDKDSKEREPQIYSRKVFLRYENVNSSFCKQCHLRKGGRERLGVAVKGADYELLHEENVAGGKTVETEKTFNHPVDITTKRIPKKIIEYWGNTGTNKDMLICETCHKVHRAAGEKLLVLDNSNSELCGICHPGMWAKDREGASSKGTHPVNVLPSTAVISRKVVALGGKVEARGKMICLTCHKTHNAPVEKGLLVVKNDQDAFCIDCHSIEEKAVKNSKHDLRFTAPDEKNIINQTAKKSGICSPCHLVHNGTGAKIWAKKIINPDTDVISQLCESCHSRFNCAQEKQVGEFSHPVNVELPKTTETGTSLPLFSRNGLQAGTGLVTCATCHDAHRWNPKAKSKTNTVKIEGNNTNSFLRQQNLKSALCYECHADKKLIRGTKHDPRFSIADQTTGSGGLCGECHSVHNAGFYMLWNRELGPGDDNLSKICNSCHAEGKIAREKTLTGYNHPLNINILKLGRYITTPLPLFDEFLSRNERGNILCSTCHDTHRWDPKATGVKDFTKAKATAGNSFLRIAANSATDALCDSCHNDMRWIRSTEHDLSVTAPDARNLQGETTAQSGVCGACHASHGGSNSFLLWNRKPGPGKDSLTKLCKSCHAAGEIAEAKQVGAKSHPLRIPMPEKHRPQHLPLFDEGLKISARGKIYCSTCHNIHRWNPNRLAYGPGENQEGDDSTSFLRISNAKGYLLCIDCHQDKELIEGTEHDLSVSAPEEENILGQNVDQAGLCGTCHLPHNSKLAQQIWARNLGPGDDMISRLCNSCHSAGNCAQNKIAGPGSHPLNVSILSADGDTDFPLFTPDGRRDSENGRVFCSTCHDPHKWDSTLQSRGSGEPEAGTQQNSFLRLPNIPKPFLCGNCHLNQLRVQNSPHDLSITAPQAKNIIGQTVAEAGVCSACHLSHNTPARIRMWARKTGPDILPGWEEKYAVAGHYGVILCTACHAPGKIAGQKLPLRALHPQNIFTLLKEPVFTPAVQALPYYDYPIGQGQLRISTSSIKAGVKPRFPVYTPDGQIKQTGDITCPTCHNPHQLRSENMGAVTSTVKNEFKRNFLRKQVQTNLCTDCHKYEAIYKFAYYHRRGGLTAAQKPAAADSPHWKEQACAACHIGDNPDKNTLKANGEVNILCAECHQKTHSEEVHPVGISVAKVGIQSPNTLPLYGNELINCLTCHQLNGHYQPDKRRLDNNPYFLRRPGKELLSFFAEQEKSGKTSYGAAAIQSKSAVRQFKTSKRKKKKQKNPKSNNYILCYECHSRESYMQFDIHRNQISADGEINQEMCLLCHTEIPDLATANPNKFKLNTGLENYCVGCHRQQIKAHPAEADHYGKQVTKTAQSIIDDFTKVGNYFIPFSNNRMTCTTCHNPHQAGVTKDKATMKGEDERWRLRFVGYEVCAICHRESYGVPSRESPF